MGRTATRFYHSTGNRGEGRNNAIQHFSGGKCDGIRQLHGSIVNLLSRWKKSAHVPHEGGAWGNSQTRKGAFSEQANRLSDNDSDNNLWLQGITPDLSINAFYLERGRHCPRGCQEA